MLYLAIICLADMTYILLHLYIFLLFNLGISNGSIWIKNVKSYGPSAIAAGLNCLSTVSKCYFESASTSTRTKILVVSFTRDLSIPADSIQKSYIKWAHGAILRGEMNEWVSHFKRIYFNSAIWWWVIIKKYHFYSIVCNWKLSRMPHQ